MCIGNTNFYHLLNVEVFFFRHRLIPYVPGNNKLETKIIGIEK